MIDASSPLWTSRLQIMNGRRQESIILNGGATTGVQSVVAPTEYHRLYFPTHRLFHGNIDADNPNHQVIVVDGGGNHDLIQAPIFCLVFNGIEDRCFT